MQDATVSTAGCNSFDCRMQQFRLQDATVATASTCPFVLVYPTFSLSLQRTNTTSNTSAQWQGSLRELLGAPPGPNSPPHRQRSGPQSDRAAFQQRPNRQYDDFRQRPERNMHDTNLPGRVLDDNSRPVRTT